MEPNRRILASALLAIGSTLAGYLLIEALLLPLTLPHLPLRLHYYLGDLRPLAQSSKAGTEPKHYVAVVGDSYAAGGGDWLLGADINRNGPFSYAHVLHARSGRDVIALGRPGAGSFEGLLREPLRQLRRIDASPWYALEPPETIVAYVYEGNDLDDNIRTLKKHELLPAGPTPSDKAKLEAFVAREIARSRDVVNPLVAPFLTFAWNAVLGNLKLLYRGSLLDRGLDFGRSTETAPGAEPQPTVAVIGGAVATLPNHLQGPALELSGEEIVSAVRLLEVSLAALRNAFPETRLVVAYIPSPLASYRLSSQTVSVQSYHQRQPVFPAELVMRRSDRLCRLVRDAARASRAAFLDVRPALRAAAAKAPIHGPRDWKHLNRQGQTVLGQALHQVLTVEDAGPGDCAAHAS